MLVTQHVKSISRSLTAYTHFYSNSKLSNGAHKINVWVGSSYHTVISIIEITIKRQIYLPALLV